MLTRKTVLGFNSERDAAEASAVLSDWPGFEDFPFVILDAGERWFLECYDNGALAEARAAGAFDSAGLAVCSQAILEVPQADWVAETQKSLPPVHAGRFIVHGSHDRAKTASQFAIEIDAGRAFGTAHHGTTKGCLLAIGALPADLHPEAGLDLGTGSGILAIAAAKVFSHRIRMTAADIDPVAVAVARENCLKNGAAASVSLFVGDGFKPRGAYKNAPFDLIVANILAKPLLKLAPRLGFLTKRGGMLVLSGILTEQAREILARYRATGFYLIRRRDLEGWATLTLRRGS